MSAEADTAVLRGGSVEEARARMLTLAPRLPSESVTLAEAFGRALAQPVRAVRDQPPFDASAMDGWAARASDLAAGDARLRVVGESAAGRPFSAGVASGEAVRISTGAPLPSGADRVVIQEEAVLEGEVVRLAPAPGSPPHVRRRGSDFREGEPLLEAGARLDAQRLALVAAAGRGSIEAARRPRVAILSTGEELTAPGVEAGPAAIFDSGGPGLAALVRGWGGEPVRVGRVGDDAAAIATEADAAEADLIVTIGGASVGDHDLVKPALRTLGLRLAVETVKMKPGKPVWFGALADGRLVLGLPGNPASAFVCAELFLRPLLAAMQGAEPALPMVAARLRAPLPAEGPREHWLRARLQTDDEGVLWAQPATDQDSSLVGVFARADALLRRPARAPAARDGEVVQVLSLGRL